MEQLFETLAEIEEKANRIMDNAHSYQSTLEQEKADKIRLLEEESKNRLQKEISDLKEKIDSELEKYKEKLESDTRKHLQALNQIQDDKLQQMADEIVAEILKTSLPC